MGIKLRLQEGKIRLEEVTVTAPFSLTLYRDHNSKVITHLKIDFKLLSLFYNKHIVVLSPEKKKNGNKKDLAGVRAHTPQPHLEVCLPGTDGGDSGQLYGGW